MSNCELYTHPTNCVSRMFLLELRYAVSLRCESALNVHFGLLLSVNLRRCSWLKARVTRIMREKLSFNYSVGRLRFRISLSLIFSFTILKYYRLLDFCLEKAEIQFVKKFSYGVKKDREKKRRVRFYFVETWRAKRMDFMKARCILYFTLYYRALNVFAQFYGATALAGWCLLNLLEIEIYVPT